MSLENHLAYSLGRKDQEPNRRLAEQLVSESNQLAVNELIDLFDSKKPRRLLMDAMLTLAYVSEIKPEWMVPHLDFLVSKLDDPIERVGWGSMIAIAHLTPVATEELYPKVPRILDVMERDSIVGRDHGFRILIQLYCVEKYSKELIHIIIEQIINAPPNQLGQYTERLLEVISPDHRPNLIEALEDRRTDLTNDHHIKRLSKNLKKLYK